MGTKRPAEWRLERRIILVGCTVGRKLQPVREDSGWGAHLLRPCSGRGVLPFRGCRLTRSDHRFHLRSRGGRLSCHGLSRRRGCRDDGILQHSGDTHVHAFITCSPAIWANLSTIFCACREPICVGFAELRSQLADNLFIDMFWVSLDAPIS